MPSKRAKEETGKPLKDIYGRVLGRVVGAIVTAGGQVVALGVEEGGGRFVQYDGKTIVRGDGEFYLMPDWKAKANGLPKARVSFHSKARAIDELEGSGDFTPEVIGELKRQLHARKPEQDKLFHDAHSRLEQLDQRDDALAEYLANVKIQFRTSEIDERTYRFAEDYSKNAMAINSKEKEELRSVIGYLENLEKGIDEAPASAPEPAPKEPEPVAATRPAASPAGEFPQVRVSLKSLRRRSE